MGKKIPIEITYKKHTKSHFITKHIKKLHLNRLKWKVASALIYSVHLKYLYIYYN